MPSEMTNPAVARVIRWLDDSLKVFEGVRRFLDAYEHALQAARAAQAERDRLQQQCEALRAEARHLHGELGRLQKERADAAHWVATMLQEAAARFPTTPPSA